MMAVQFAPVEDWLCRETGLLRSQYVALSVEQVSATAFPFHIFDFISSVCVIDNRHHRSKVSHFSIWLQLDLLTA